MVGDDVRDDVLGAQQVHNNIIQYLCGMINDFMVFLSFVFSLYRDFA